MGRKLFWLPFIHSFCCSWSIECTPQITHFQRVRSPASVVACSILRIRQLRLEATISLQHMREPVRSSPTNFCWIKCIKLVGCYGLWYTEQMAKLPELALSHLGGHWRLISMMLNIFVCIMSILVSLLPRRGAALVTWNLESIRLQVLCMLYGSFCGVNITYQLALRCISIEASVFVYGSENWATTEMQIQQLDTFDMKQQWHVGHMVISSHLVNNGDI